MGPLYVGVRAEVSSCVTWLLRNDFRSSGLKALNHRAISPPPPPAPPPQHRVPAIHPISCTASEIYVFRSFVLQGKLSMCRMARNVPVSFKVQCEGAVSKLFHNNDLGLGSSCYTLCLSSLQQKVCLSVWKSLAVLRQGLWSCHIMGMLVVNKGDSPFTGHVVGNCISGIKRRSLIPLLFNNIFPLQL